MKDLSLNSKLYLLAVYLSAATLFTWKLVSGPVHDPLMVTLLSALALVTLILKVSGTTARSHYTISFLVYGFTFTHLGITETLVVIVVSNLLEWLWKRTNWYIQLFNTGCYVLVMYAAYLVFSWVNPLGTLDSLLGVFAITASMATFTLLNHLMVGIVVWFARGENFKESGIFDVLPLIIDVTLLIFGAVIEIVWRANPFAIVLFLLPLYLIYGTLRVPALERQTEIDAKTGLFNHAYFVKHLNNELKRANRFDSPLTLVMADLDLLRNINNTYGHLAGDEVLIGIARILKQSVREYDVVARFGGEEFAILLVETSLEQAFKRAEAIRKAVENASFSIPTSIAPIKATLSLGLAGRERFDQPAQEIIHNADTALYKSKLKGRNQTFAFMKTMFYQMDAQEQVVVYREVAASEMPVSQPAVQSTQYLASEAQYILPVAARAPVERTVATAPVAPLEKQAQPSRKYLVDIYISSVLLFSLLLFAGTFQIGRLLFVNLGGVEWVGVAVCAILVVITEWFSIDLYIGKSSLSTSAVPILAGVLLYGPIGGLLLSLAYSITVGVKYHNHLNRYFFNFSNQLIASLLYSLLIHLIGVSFLEMPNYLQISLAVVSALIVYFSTTALIAFGMSLDLQQSFIALWKEQYAWMVTMYAAIGVIAAGLIFGYKTDNLFGPLLILVPLAMLRFSQKQYVDRTREMVTELREKNMILEQHASEINELNEGLLNILAEIIDLRDPYVLGHSKQVTRYATDIARELGLDSPRVELIRKAGLLHDIGKLGIAMEILAKPARLTPEEYETVKTHAHLGGVLLEKTPALRPIMPIVRHHHEFYNGRGYPDGLAGNQIPVEARIIAVSDAIEAMASDRPYRKGLKPERIISELEKYAGTQFDPLVVEQAVKMLKSLQNETIRETSKEYDKLVSSSSSSLVH